MQDLRWTIPVARWSSWPAGATTTPDIGFVEPLMRRRLSTLSKMALKVAHDCAAEGRAVRLVFASRHGELRRTTGILDDIVAGEPVSPTAFSLSVLNAMAGVHSIARRDRSPSTAISAGAQTLGYALLEAHAQYAADPSTPVLVVYADEPADERYGAIEHEASACALAVLLDRDAQVTLECETSYAPEAQSAPGFATQRDALLHALSCGSAAHGAVTWQGAGRHWRWSVRNGGAV
jgi:hypothetical protein